MKKKSVKNFFAVAILHPLWAKVFNYTEYTEYTENPKSLTLDFEKQGQKDR